MFHIRTEQLKMINHQRRKQVILLLTTLSVLCIGFGFLFKAMKSGKGPILLF